MKDFTQLDLHIDLPRLLTRAAWVCLVLALVAVGLAAIFTIQSARNPASAEWKDSVLVEGTVVKKWFGRASTNREADPEADKYRMEVRYWTSMQVSHSANVHVDSERTWRKTEVGDRVWLRPHPKTPGRVLLQGNLNTEFFSDEESVILGACGVLMLLLAGGCWGLARRFNRRGGTRIQS